MQKTAHARANSVLRKAGVDRVPKWTATDSESEAECVEPEVARAAVARVSSATAPITRGLIEREKYGFQLGVAQLCQLEQYLNEAADNCESNRKSDEELVTIWKSFEGRMAIFLFLALPLLAPRGLDDIEAIGRVREQCALFCWNMLPKSTSTTSTT